MCLGLYSRSRRLKNHRFGILLSKLKVAALKFRLFSQSLAILQQHLIVPHRLSPYQESCCRRCFQARMGRRKVRQLVLMGGILLLMGLLILVMTRYSCTVSATGRCW